MKHYILSLFLLWSNIVYSSSCEREAKYVLFIDGVRQHYTYDSYAFAQLVTETIVAYNPNKSFALAKEIIDINGEITLNFFPSATLEYPKNGQVFNKGDTLIPKIVVIDQEFGDVSDDIVFSSSLQGFFLKYIHSLKVGHHTITPYIHHNGEMISFKSATINVVDNLKVTLSWGIPTERENGDQLLVEEIAGYDIHIVSDNYDQIINVIGGDVTSYIHQVPKSGLYHFSIATVDTNNLTSKLSEEVSKDI